MLYSILPSFGGRQLYLTLRRDWRCCCSWCFPCRWWVASPVHGRADCRQAGSQRHAFLTFMVALPSFITAFTVAASLEHGARQRGGKGLFAWWAKLPYFSREGDQWLFSYFIAGLLLFLFGGITGIVNASYNLNLAVHNTSWVVGHFHTTVGGLVTLAFLGISLYMMAKLRGVEVKAKGLAVAAPYLWLIGMMVFEVAMSVAAFYGFPRRTAAGASYIDPASPLYHPEWYFWAHLSAGGGAIAVLGFVAYLVSFLGTLFARPVREPVVEFPMAEALARRACPRAEQSASVADRLDSADCVLVYLPHLRVDDEGHHGEVARLWRPASRAAEADLKLRRAPKSRDETAHPDLLTEPSPASQRGWGGGSGRWLWER